MSEVLVLDESGQNAVEPDEDAEVPSTVLRSEVLSGSQEVAKKVFASLLVNGEVTLEEDEEEEAEAEEPVEEEE